MSSKIVYQLFEADTSLQTKYNNPIALFFLLVAKTQENRDPWLPFPFTFIVNQSDDAINAPGLY